MGYYGAHNKKEPSPYINGCSVDLGFLKRACYKIQPQVRKTFADNRNIKVNWRVVYINSGIIKAEINMVDIIHKRYKWALKISKK